jgi:dihydrodipicolinate synthase/N-acetylneuraminate lyase
MLIQGIFAAIPTPFYSDERVYLRKLEANVEHWSRSPLAGLLVLGSNGEAVLLGDEESEQVLKVAAEAAAPEKVMVAGANRESVGQVLRLAEAAARFGYDALLVRTPVYYAAQMSRTAVETFFRTVADRSPLPILLYNIPRSVPYNIPVEVVAELASHPNILGIKDSAGDLDQIKRLIAATRNAPQRTVTVTPTFEAVTGRMLKPKPQELVTLEGMAGGATASALKTRTKEIGFQVLTGSAGILLEALEAGASAAILGAASFAPEACNEVYLAWKDHDLKLAAAKQERIAGAARRVVGELGSAGVKYACDYNGYYGGLPRLPLLPPTAAEKAEIETLLAKIRS